MTEKSHRPQAEECNWDSIMRQLVKIYAEEMISEQQVNEMSERILERIEMRDIRQRNLTLVVGGAGKKPSTLRH